MSDAEHIPALAVYGSLAPGESNHWVVSRIAGDWVDGVIHGYIFEVTWGPAEGFEGFIPDRDGPRVPVSVLLSEQLERSWREVDEFQGKGYERQQLPVLLGNGQTINANIYVALTDT